MQTSATTYCDAECQTTPEELHNEGYRKSEEADYDSEDSSYSDDEDACAEDDPDWDFTDCGNVSDCDDVEGTDSSEELIFGSSPNPVHQRKFIVFEQCLVQLFFSCSMCLVPCQVFLKHIVGSCITVEQRCKAGHHRVWSSQPFSGTLPSNYVLSAVHICKCCHILNYAYLK